jgi:hypothetical protein
MLCVGTATRHTSALLPTPAYGTHLLNDLLNLNQRLSKDYELLAQTVDEPPVDALFGSARHN